MPSSTVPDVLLRTLLTDERISIAEAISALHLLAPMVMDEGSGGPSRNLASKILGRVDDPDEEVLYLLDWWYYVTTNQQSGAARLYRIPPSLDTGLGSALEALRDVDVAAAPARWVRAKRELPQLVARLESRLDLDSYGSVKLPSEREVWAEFCESVAPVCAALEANRRADPAVLQEDSLAKVMRQLGIDENSARWRQVFDRMRAATDHINHCVEVQHLAEPWKRNVDVPTVDSLPAALEARLGPMARLVFAPLRQTMDPTVEHEREVAEQLEELAHVADDRQKIALADIVGAWIEDHALPVPTIKGLMEQRNSILERKSRLERQGVDVFEVDYHLEDSNLGEAEAALKRADAGRLVTEKKAKLERQLASVEERGAQLADEVPDHLAATIAEARNLLASDNPDGASELLRSAQDTLGNLEHAAGLAEFERLIGDLDAMQAPPSTIYDYRKQLEELRSGPPDAAGARECVASIRQTLSSFGEGRREDAQRRIQRIEDVLEEAAGEFSAAARGEIELLVGRAENLLESGRIAEAFGVSRDAERLCEQYRVHRWSASDGEENLVRHILDYCTQDVDFNELDIRRFYVALKTKPFVIVAGLTGSGKSTLARLVAESMGATSVNGQFQRVAVRPDWIDQSEVLGFVNPTSNRFEPGWLADLLRRCERETDRMFFVLLDEMNLAPVEQYLAEVLSAMEEARSGGRDVKIPLYSRGATPANQDEWAAELTFPSNLLFIGTVNVDETTRPLSDRVIDRANVIQLTINPSDHHHGDGRAVRNVKPWTVQRSEWLKVCTLRPDDSAHAFLVHVTEALRQGGIGLGMRAHVELERFLANANGVIPLEVALDFGVLQRIIPKIRGFKRDLAETLEELEELLEERKCTRCRSVVAWWRDGRLSDDEYLDGTDARLALRHS